MKGGGRREKREGRREEGGGRSFRAYCIYSNITCVFLGTYTNTKLIPMTYANLGIIEKGGGRREKEVNDWHLS